MIIDTVAYPADEKHVFERALLFLRAEGFLPAPESAYSVCCAIDEALKCRETGEAKAIAFSVSGRRRQGTETVAAGETEAGSRPLPRGRDVVR